jgi:hypothetical protein
MYLAPLHVLKDRVGGVEGLAAAASVTVSPDGEHIYVAGRFWTTDSFD